MLEPRSLSLWGLGTWGLFSPHQCLKTGMQEAWFTWLEPRLLPTSSQPQVPEYLQGFMLPLCLS